jgi:hexosaminidase
MPGHATAANRAYPAFSGGGTGRFANFTFNPGKQGTYSYLTNILRETAKLFPSKMIHLGGDEVALGSKGWKDNPEIKKLMAQEDLANAKSVEFYFIHKMTDSALKIYNKALLWDEAVDASLPADRTIIFWWRHDLTDQLVKALQKDYEVVLCPRVPLYFDFVQDSTHRLGRKWKGDFSSLAKVYNFPDGQIDTIIGNNSHVLGMQANLWTEDVKTLKRLEFLLFPRIAALSEAAWSKSTNKNYPQFLNTLKSHLLYYQKEGIFYYDPFDPGKTPEIL